MSSGSVVIGKSVLARAFAPTLRFARKQGVRAGLLAAALALAACVDVSTEHRVRGNAFLKGGDATAALGEFDKGLAAKPGDIALLILRGKALFELDRFDDAKTSYASAIDAGKADRKSLAEAQLGLAMIAARRDDWPEARKRFEELVEIGPSDATSHLNLARACLKLGDLECALAHGDTAGKLRGEEENVLFTLGTIYLAAGKADLAEAKFKHICDVVPSAASCPYGVALVAAKAGDKSRAIAQLREAVVRKLPNPKDVAVDPGFASLKGDPDFEAIIAGLGK